MDPNEWAESLKQSSERFSASARLPVGDSHVPINLMNSLLSQSSGRAKQKVGPVIAPKYSFVAVYGPLVWFSSRRLRALQILCQILKIPVIRVCFYRHLLISSIPGSTRQLWRGESPSRA